MPNLRLHFRRAFQYTSSPGFRLPALLESLSTEKLLTELPTEHPVSNFLCFLGHYHPIYWHVFTSMILPPGTFKQAGGGVKANLLFFTKGRPTERIWYYDISDVKVTKKSPLTLANFEEFFKLLPSRSDSELSWSVNRQDIEAKNYDIKAVNPNRKDVEDTRTPEELMDIIEAKGREVVEALAELRSKKKP